MLRSLQQPLDFRSECGERTTIIRRQKDDLGRCLGITADAGFARARKAIGSRSGHNPIFV